MKRKITVERENVGVSKTRLAQMAGLNPGTIIGTESGRLVPYPVQLAKMAAALGWTGDPAALMDEVDA